jgi:hypothetical protein
MTRTIRLPHALIVLHRYGAVTHFPADDSFVPATPQWEDLAYSERAQKLGYGTDLVRMCQDHEVLHSVAAELLRQGPSDVLWAVAHGDLSRRGRGAEENLVLRLQRELKR